MSSATLTAEADAAIAADIACLRSLVEASRVEDARSLVKQLETRWPDSEEVKSWARVLAPPRFLGRSPASGGSLERERDWLRAHAKDYPGCWLALDGDRLIAADPGFKVVLSAVKSTGVSDALMHFQPAPRE
jgi:hypothetical protein